jgi:hypothetical protein
MIRRMVSDLSDLLRERGFALPIVYGPERTERLTRHATHIVFERDREGGDAFAPADGRGRDPHYRGVRVVGVQAWVIARSPRSGARTEDHEELSDLIVDGIHCALYRWASEAKSKVDWAGVTGRFLAREELEGGDLERFDGTVYRMTFSVARGVYDRTYEQDSPQDRGLITGVSDTLTANGSAPGGVFNEFSTEFSTEFS